MIAIVLVGGKSVHVDVLTPVCEQPFLYWLTLWLKSQGIYQIVYSAGNNADEIQSWAFQMADCQPDLCLDVVEETRPLGTAGAASLCAKRFPSPYTILLNGNSILLTPILPQLKKLKANPKLDGIIFGTQLINAGRFGNLEISSGNQLISFKEKQAGKGLINAGVYLLRNNLFDDIIADKELSLEYDCFPTWLQERKRFEVTDDAAPFFDIGTPESLKRANELIENYQSLLCSYAESV